MAVDKNLFLYDLAIVAIMKCEGPYLKEWLDYHLLAGVDHFYIYDNDSPDNQREVAAPYVKAGLVDYFHLPGKAMQMFAYNDAVKRFKFHCRYMAFIDGDEFIFPKVNHVGGGYNIVEVVDEILSGNPNASGLAMHWQLFGSNGQEKADYSRGVLERFTRRNYNRLPERGYVYVKIIANPRKINFVMDPHLAIYFDGCFSVDEKGTPVMNGIVDSFSVDKIALNHYHCKSWEEYQIKRPRGIADKFKFGIHAYDRAFFDEHDRNDVFDDSILKYRDERAKNFSLETDDEKLNRVTAALNKTLSDFANEKISDLETALTCRALSNYLGLKLHEEASLAAILNSLDGLKLSDARLLIRELPELLSLPYSAVKELRIATMNIISQLMNVMHLNNVWIDYVELDYLQRLLRNFKE